jgi:hypothetical protein
MPKAQYPRFKLQGALLALASPPEVMFQFSTEWRDKCAHAQISCAVRLLCATGH